MTETETMTETEIRDLLDLLAAWESGHRAEDPCADPFSDVVCPIGDPVRADVMVGDYRWRAS